MDSSRSALPLQGARFGNKRFHQGAHLAALVVPAQHMSAFTFTICSNLTEGCVISTLSLSIVSEALLVFFSLSGVDDEHHVGNSHARLGDVGRQDNLKETQRINDYIFSAINLR